MITFSAAAQEALLQHGAKPAFKVEIEYDSGNDIIQRGGGSLLDITHLVTSFPSLRSSIRPIARIPELTGLTVSCFNPDGKFDVNDINSWVGHLAFHRARLTIKMGVEMGQTEELFTMYVGELDDVIANLDANTVELSCVDPFARLKGSNFGDASGEYSKNVPAFAVQRMLEAAGFGPDIDTTSFNIQKSIERSTLGMTLHAYEPSNEGNTTTWWEAIKLMLLHNNGGLFWNGNGKIQIFTIAPSLVDPEYTFNRTLNAESIKTRKPGGTITNRYSIYIDDGSGSSPPTFTNLERVAGAPREMFVFNSQSGGIFGVIAEDLEFRWTFDDFGGSAIGKLIASVLLTITAFGPKVATVVAPLDTFVVEMWDYVKVLDTEIGIDFNGFVYEKVIDYEAATCVFKIFNIPLTEPDPDDPSVEYLQTNNSQKYDDNVPIYGQSEQGPTS